MASDLYAGVKIGDPNATFNSKITLNGTVDWKSTEALAPLEACKVSIIPPSSDVQVRNNVISYRAENEFGDSSFGTISSTGSHISVDEKGTVQIKAASPVSEDMTCGRIEMESQTNMRLNVGTSFAINVNASGQHDEEGDVSNSSTQTVDKKRYPAFSINVSNGGIDVECSDGDIFFSGKNIVFNAAETLTLNATKAVNILSGFEPAQVATAALGGLFGFELPASGGGEVVIKAGKFTNDSTTVSTSSSKESSKTGAVKISETGSSNATVSDRSSGDKVIATSGNVLIQAGQKMRIEAQGTIVNPTGPSVPPMWGTGQLEPLVISVNKNNTPVDRAMLIEVDNGDFVASIKKLGDAAITTEQGFLGLYAGRGDTKTTSAFAGDLILESVKGNIVGKAPLEIGFLGGTVAGIGIGKEGLATDFLAAYKDGSGYGQVGAGATLKSGTGLASVLGKTQAGIGIGETPQASTNFLAFNPVGALLNITGPLTGNISGASTFALTGSVTTQITGSNTINVTGANTSNVTGANIRNVTGLVADKSQTGVTIESPGTILIKAASTVTIDGPSGIFLN